MWDGPAERGVLGPNPPQHRAEPTCPQWDGAQTSSRPLLHLPGSGVNKALPNRVGLAKLSILSSCKRAFSPRLPLAWTQVIPRGFSPVLALTPQHYPCPRPTGHELKDRPSQLRVQSRKSVSYFPTCIATLENSGGKLLVSASWLCEPCISMSVLQLPWPASPSPSLPQHLVLLQLFRSFST